MPGSYTGPPSTFDGTSSQTSSIAHEFKGELKAEISNFSTIFFAKSNINEVNFIKLFSLVYCFFVRKLRSKLDFSRFCDVFIVGSKTKSAACCDI